MLGVVAALASIWPLFEARSINGATNVVSSGALSLRGVIPTMLSYFLFACGYIVYMTFVFAWMREQDMSWQFGTLVWGVLGVSVAASPFVWRRALETWNPAVTLAASCATTLLGTIIPIYFATTIGVLVSATLFGLGMFIAPSSVAVLSRQKFDPGQLAKAITLFTVVFSIGQAIGPVVAGWIADMTTLDYSLAFGAIMLGAASCIALIRFREVRPRTT